MSYNTPTTFLNNSILSGSFATTPTANIQHWLDFGYEYVNTNLWASYQGQIPFASGSVPAMVLMCENLVCAYWLLVQEGFNPEQSDASANDWTIYKQYVFFVGDGTDQNSGILGQWRTKKLPLLNPNDEQAEPVASNVGVTGQIPRRWQQGPGGGFVF